MRRKPFEYLPHTADVAFVAYGPTFASALENAARALLDTMLDVKRIKRLRSKTIRIEIGDAARSREDVAWYILQDILSRIDAEKLNAYDFRVSGFGESGSGARVAGTLLCKDEPGDFALLAVKAVTPHGLEVKESRGACSISVVVDV